MWSPHLFPKCVAFVQSHTWSSSPGPKEITNWKRMYILSR